MSHKPWSLLACAAAGILVLVPGAAHALSCAAPGVMAPLWDAKDVPTNTLVWCSHAFAETAAPIRVTDPDGQLVTGTQTVLTAPQFKLAVFRPDAELAPNTYYSVECQTYPGEEPRFFSTGAGPLEQRPELPRLDQMSVTARSDSGWGSSLLHASFENISPQDAILVLDLEGGEPMNASQLTGSVDDATFVYGPTGMAFVGRGLCFSNWPGAELGASIRVRYGALDITGAFSGWTGWRTVTLPSQFEDREVGGPDVVTTPPGPPVNPEPEGDDVLFPDAPPAPDVDPSTSTPTGAVPELELADDGLAAPSRKSSGCQLGVRSSSGSAAGSLAALAYLFVRRKRRSAARG